MQPLTSPGDRVGTCRSPESQCIGMQVQSPHPKPSSTVPFATLLPAAGTMVGDGADRALPVPGTGHSGMRESFAV